MGLFAKFCSATSPLKWKKYNRLPISEKSGSTSDINLNYYLAKNNSNSYENVWGDRWEIYIAMIETDFHGWFDGFTSVWLCLSMGWDSMFGSGIYVLG